MEFANRINGCRRDTKDLVHDLVVTRDAEDNVRRFKDEDNDGLCKLRFLEQVAFKKLFVESAARDDESWIFTTEWLFDEAKTYCPQFNIKPQDFVADVKATALLREVAKGVWAFSHLTIQEYLAARALAGSALAIDIIGTYGGSALEPVSET